MAHVKELGYIGIEASDLGAWEAFGVGVLGLQLASKDAERLVFRMDGKAHRITVQAGPADDLVRQGYDCFDAATLDALVAALSSAGHAVEDGGSDLAAERQVERVAVVHDPMGNRVELYVGLADADAPFERGVSRSGFQTENGGAGHAVLAAKDRQAALDFYGILGFTVSDYILQEIAPGFVLDAVFTHCNGRHHTLAFGDIPGGKRIQHFMTEVHDAQDVGLAWDRVVRGGLAPVTLTLGVHPNDEMFSFYMRNPSGFEWEYGSGGLLISDEESWEVKHFDAVSTWGHIPAPLLAQALAPPR
jgi:2,3-dihydroxybiphenyl 1,2-dioxygenase